MLKIWWFEAIQELTDLTNAISGGKVTPATAIYRLEQLLEVARKTWPQQAAGVGPANTDPGSVWLTGEISPELNGGLSNDF